MEDIRIVRERAQGLLAMGKFEAALSDLAVLAERDVKGVVHRQKMGDVFVKLGRPRDAIREYETAVQQYVATGEPLKAIGLCRVILQHDKNHTRTQQMLADLYARRRGGPVVIARVALKKVEVPARSQRPAQDLESGLVVLPPLEEPALAAPPPPPSFPGLRVDQAPDVIDIELPELPAAAPDGAADETPRIPLFSELGPSAFVELARQVQMRTFDAGEVIVREGDEGSSMFALVQGTVNVLRAERAGNPQIVAQLREGAFFGEMALMAEVPRMATVVAAEECLLMEFTQKKIKDVIKAYPSVGRVLERFYRERMLANLLRSSPIFRPLTSEQRASLSELFKPRSCKRNAVLLHQGQRSDALYLLMRGRCEVFNRTAEGKNVTYGELCEGDVFGEISLLTGKPVTATVRATADSTVLRLGREHVERIILPNEKIREALLQLVELREQRNARTMNALMV